MSVEKKQVNVAQHTLENAIPVDPERSLLPILLVGDRVLIEPVENEDEKYLSKEANIQKPVSAKTQFKRGRIVSIGGGEYGQSIPATMKTNMLVEYFHNVAIDYVVEKKVYHLVRASDVWGYL